MQTDHTRRYIDCTKVTFGYGDLVSLTASRNIDGVPHLSSDLIVQKASLYRENPWCAGDTRVRQGPSLEYRSQFSDESKPGTDLILSLHCPFWPNGASEWINRPRLSGWPTPHDIYSIVDFECHIVLVGRPLSPRREMEWRISFSIAERILVWSFNHVQMQCYAVMKIVLKEFIKIRCSP